MGRGVKDPDSFRVSLLLSQIVRKICNYVSGSCQVTMLTELLSLNFLTEAHPSQKKTTKKTRKHSSRVHTAHFSHSGGASLQRPPLTETLPPWTEIPPP